jgi:hypothetical protein
VLDFELQLGGPGVDHDARNDHGRDEQQREQGRRDAGQRVRSLPAMTTTSAFPAASCVARSIF